MSTQMEHPLSIDHRKFNWVTAGIMAFFHIGAVAAFFYFSWSAVLTAVFLYWVAGSLGIGMSYHRLLTHRGYKTPKPVEYFLTLCATLALERGPISWVTTHRIHHRFSDRDGDPHTPNDGKWWAHMGWVLSGNSMHHDAAVVAKYSPDLASDPVHRWLTEYHWVPTAVLSVILYLIGGLPFLLWGVFFRAVFGLHCTWLVNSATHIWGTRRFKTTDRSTNSWWVALLSFGEGWHNNHHAHPVSARHGLRWYEVDFNWYGIWALKRLGLAKQIYCATAEGARNPATGTSPVRQRELAAHQAAFSALNSLVQDATTAPMVFENSEP
jgi:fatty-acid desaturase